nr:MAG TPA: protein of unknown function DUF393 [Caudoviricetes sp.]
MRHCDDSLPFFTKWFLLDIKDFKNRSLEIAFCPICNKEVVQLTEYRVSDNKKFVDVQAGTKAHKIKLREKKRLDYIVKKQNASSGGWIYGVNRERKNKQGFITAIKQYAYDYSSNKSKGLIKSKKTDLY